MNAYVDYCPDDRNVRTCDGCKSVRSVRGLLLPDETGSAVAPREFQVGDRVRVKDYSSERYVFPGHDFKAGDTGTVVERDNTGRQPIVSRDGGSLRQYIDDSHLELIPTETPAPEEPTVIKSLNIQASNYDRVVSVMRTGDAQSDTLVTVRTEFAFGKSPRGNTGIGAALTKAEARELALNLLIATGDAPATASIKLDYDGEVLVETNSDEYGTGIYASSDAEDDFAHIGRTLFGLVHAPAALKAKEDADAEAARVAEIEKATAAATEEKARDLHATYRATVEANDTYTKLQSWDGLPPARKAAWRKLAEAAA